MLRIVRSSIWVLVLLAALPGGVLGQEVKAGIATVIEGDVTTRRASLPQPVPLRFRDDVFRQDTIVTAERSLARLLLGGKAVVTVRERSRLTVTEVPGTSLVELGTGKVGLAVVRERMQPGDVVEIRTHNAIIAVRGTVVIAEIVPVTAPSGASPKAPALQSTVALQSNVYVLTGKVEARELRGGVPFGPVYPVGRRQMITVSPLGPPQVTSIPESRIAEITAGLQPSGKSAGGAAAQAAAKETALRAAASEVALGPGGDEDRLLSDWRLGRAPIVPTLPTFSDSAVTPLAQPPMQDISPALPPTRPSPPVVVNPSQPPTGLVSPSLVGPSTRGGLTGTKTQAPAAGTPANVDLGSLTGLKSNTRLPSPPSPR